MPLPGPAVFTAFIRDISERHEARRALQESNDRYRRLSELALEGIIIHENGVLLDANATYLKSLMVTPANASDFAKTKPTEVVTIRAYNTSTKTASGIGIQISRPVGAIVTPSIAGSLPSATVVLVNVTYQWSMLGGRSGSEQTETIISSGTKK